MMQQMDVFADKWVFMMRPSNEEPIESFLKEVSFLN